MTITAQPMTAQPAPAHQTLVGILIGVAFAACAIFFLTMFVHPNPDSGISYDDRHASIDAEICNSFFTADHADLWKQRHPTTYNDFLRIFSDNQPILLSREDAARYAENNNNRTVDYKLYVAYPKGSTTPTISNKHIDSLVGTP